MATALRSSPPPAAEASDEARAKYLQRRPATKVQNPRVYDGDARAAQLLDRLMKRLGISNVELGECIGMPESKVRAMRDGSLAIKVGHIYAMERRFGCRLFAEYEEDRRTFNHNG
jgi:hypothetical protein